MDTNVSTSNVSSITKNANTIYAEVVNSANQLVQLKEQIPNFWRGNDAKKITEAIDTLLDKMEYFTQEFDVFMNSLDYFASILTY